MNNCWRLTDNRHWDSPGRMSDGRTFTDWRSISKTNEEIAKRANIASRSQMFSELLQSSYGFETERGIIEEKNTTGDRWGIEYKPPPPKGYIVADARNGTTIIETKRPDGIGLQVETRGWEQQEYSGRLSQNTQVMPSICGPLSIRSPSWGLSPDTLILNLRPAQTAGGSTTAWIDNSYSNEYRR